MDATFFETPDRRVAVYWVVSAKREETRRRRLAELIAASEQRRPIGPTAGARKPRRAGTSSCRQVYPRRLQ